MVQFYRRRFGRAAVKVNIGRSLMIVLVAVALNACAPKIGSEGWCKMMNDKPKGEWSGNDAAAYTKHCVLGMKADE